MKRTFLLSLSSILLTITTLLAQTDKSVPDKASPFTAVEWQDNIPQVRFEGEWYTFETIDGISRESLLQFCKNNYGEKWQKRFTEDLVEVLNSMNHQPKLVVTLLLTQKGITKTFKGKLTFENRQMAKKHAEVLAENKEQRLANAYLSKAQAEEDLSILIQFIDKHSSYNGLNGYNALDELNNYLKNLPDSVFRTDFGLFLTRTIGKIGDRHANVRNYELPNNKHFPYAFAPLSDRVLVLSADESTNGYKPAFENFPYLKRVGEKSLDELLKQVAPEDIAAPKEAYLTRAVRTLRNIQSVYSLLGKETPNEVKITLTNRALTKDTILNVSLVDRIDIPSWYNRSQPPPANVDKKESVETLFTFDDGIAHIVVPEMWGSDEAPLFFEQLEVFLQEAKTNSKALIIDVRDNGGGTRDLIWELAGYFVHPDSVHVVNVAQQRGQILPLNEQLKADLHGRYLYTYDELDKSEQKAVDMFKKDFTPMYALDPKRYSQNHYAVFNGAKITEGKYYYTRPVYILANERSFSAASVLVTCFKGLPNITIAGITTDGSSGNSEHFYLPNSALRGRISTMVSFQKDGKTLDRFGTAPDIEIPRDLPQVLGQRDSQLEKLKAIILQEK